jgi:F0F1-type ATP synthase assembly protein I
LVAQYAACGAGNAELNGLLMAEDKNLWLQIARYSQLAMVLPTCTVVGLVAGWALGKWLHHEWLEIAGLLLGIAAGFVELVRTVMSNEKSGN